jgi:hypothetical protein
MAREAQVFEDISLEANADLSAKQHTIMHIVAANRVTFGTGGTTKNIGVLQNKPAAAGRAAEVRVAGLSKLQIGASVSVGDHITADSAGRGVGTTTDGHICVGYALEAGDAADETITLLILPHVVFVA